MIRRAAMISAAGRYAGVLLSVAVSAVLARLLTPEDYGVVAVITVFSAFFSTLSNMGFGTAVIQKKELSGDEVRDIFSFTVFVALLLALLFAAFSHVVARIYGNPVYVPLGQLLSISLFFSAADMTPNGILNREKKFAFLAVRSFTVSLVSAGAAIAAAYAGLRYYALVLQAILSGLLGFLWDCAVTRPGFHLRFSMAPVRKVFSYSGFQFAFNLVNYFSRNLDNLLTGKYLGSAQLGFYNKAYTLMLYPVNNLAGVVSPVLHPVLSDYQDRKEIIYEKYLRVLRFFICVGAFVAPVCFLCADEIIGILFGDQWSASAACFRLLAVAIIPQMMNSGAGGVFQSLGNTRLLFLNSCINTVITVSAILAGIFWGGDIVVLSGFVAAAYVLHTVTAFYMLIRYGFGYSLRAFLSGLKKEGLLVAVMAASDLVFPFQADNLWLSALVKGLWLLVFYCGGLLLTGDDRLLVSVLRGRGEGRVRTFFDSLREAPRRLLCRFPGELNDREVDICIAMPDYSQVHAWGDWYFALAMKREFENAGYRVNVRPRCLWYRRSQAKFVLVLRGLTAFRPVRGIRGQFYLMWNISHPDEVKVEECNRYDYVFFASDRLTAKYRELIVPGCETLLQCAESDTAEAAASYADETGEELLFVGNSRGVYRKILSDFLPTEHALAVYGGGWENTPVSEYVVRTYLDREETMRAYRRAKIVLNDHWNDMRENGVVSNRIFDVLAAGGFVISDDLPEIGELFGETVPTYRSREELLALIDYYLSHEAERRHLAEEGRWLVLREHTFRQRTDRILEVFGELESVG